MAASDVAAAVAETHVSTLFFVGDRAFKLKKPVQLGFLDFRDRAAREAACHREVELNRRFAPDVYLGVLDVTDGSGAVVDHLVAMRRMPADRRLAAMVASGIDVSAVVRGVARVVAAAHAVAPTGPTIDAEATAEAVARKWAANLAELRRQPIAAGVTHEIDEIERLATRYVGGRGALFAERIADGWARDGHGDLLADDVYCLDDGPRLLDCLEFDDTLRYGDVLADVAFLAMDLERLGAGDAAAAFVRRWQELVGETHPPSLEHHYVAFRALIRAKVAAIRAAQERRGHDDRCRALLDIALRHLRLGRVRIVVVGGAPGSGKSTLAAALGRELGWPVLGSDVTRKELHGLAADAPAGAGFGAGLYGVPATARTYATLRERAGTAAGLGQSVILDATWLDPEQRRQIRSLACAVAADLVELRCAVPVETAVARVVSRPARAAAGSDATAAVARRLAGSAAPWPEATVVDTSGSVAAAAVAALAAVTGAQRCG